MSARIKIDFVSDVSCPWCVIGLKSLQTALGRLGGERRRRHSFPTVRAQSPDGSEGQDLMEHITQKYGSTQDQVGATGKPSPPAASNSAFTSI